MQDAYLLLAGVFSVFVLTCLAALWVSLRMRKQIDSQYRWMAQQLGLSIEIPKTSLGGLFRKNPALYGQVSSRECAIYSLGHGLDNTRQTDTAIRLQTTASRALQFALSAQTLEGKLAQAARGEVCPSGDATFDRSAVLKSRDPKALKPQLNPAVLECMSVLMQTPKAYLTLQEGVFMFTHEGLIHTRKSAENLLHCLETLTALADRLEI